MAFKLNPVTGNLDLINNQASGIGGLTEGSIPFADASGFLTESNTTLFRDTTTGNVGIGTTPTTKLDILNDSGNYALALRTNDNTARPGIKMEAIRPTPAGIAFNIFDLSIGNSESSLISAGIIGLFGFVGPSSNVLYMHFGTETTSSYLNNTFRLYPNKNAYFDGKVGIKTTNPLSTLHINGGVGNLATGWTLGDGDMGGYEISDDLMAFGKDGANTLVVDGVNSRVGVLTDTPLFELDVNGDINAEGKIQSTSTKNTVSFKSDYSYGASYPSAVFSIGSTYGTSIASSGLVIAPDNIGTTVQKPTYLNIYTNSTASANRKSLAFWSTETLAHIRTWSNTGGGAGADIAIGTYGNYNQIYAKNGGNVGFNTDNPLSRLHINGGVGSLATGWTLGDGDIGAYEISDDVMAFGKDGANTLVVDGVNGRVGIGTGTPTQVLDVKGNINLSGMTVNPDNTSANINSSAATLTIGNNTFGGYVNYPADYNVFKNISGNRYVNGGVVYLNDVASSVVNGSIKFTNSISTGVFSWMGSVGIGTATPLSKLHINGGVGSLSTGLSWGDGDTGIFENTDDQLVVAIGGANTWVIESGQIRAAFPDGGIIINETSSSTNPTLGPSWQDKDTGLGRSGLDQLSLIAGGVEGMRIVEDTTIYAEHKGGTRKPITTKTADYTITLSDSTILLDGTSNTVTATLPTAVGNTGQIFTVKCINKTNTCTLDGNSTETIDGELSYELMLYDTVKVQSNGSSWYII